jgi:hypothetical protein
MALETVLAHLRETPITVLLFGFPAENVARLYVLLAAVRIRT